MICHGALFVVIFLSSSFLFLILFIIVMTGAGNWEDYCALGHGFRLFVCFLAIEIPLFASDYDLISSDLYSLHSCI
jgi:hypothetical protein